MSDALRRVVRTLLQLVASGGLTAAVNAFAHGLDPAVATLVLAGFQLVVTFAQNAAEDSGLIPAILKAPASSGVNPVPPAA